MSACSMLEIQLGMIGWTATKGERWTEDWYPITGSWSRAQRLLSDGMPRLSPDLALRVRALVDDSKPSRDQRNALAHATFVFDPETTLASNPWLIRTTRNIERALISDDEGAALVSKMNRLSKILPGRCAPRSLARSERVGATTAATPFFQASYRGAAGHRKDTDAGRRLAAACRLLGAPSKCAPVSHPSGPGRDRLQALVVAGSWNY